jgi:HPt (histidine-containing phosphotransfer) domain-containing protein
MESLQDEMHTLKSLGATFGATRLHLLAKSMEADCRAGNREAVQKQAADLEQVLQDTLKAYRGRFQYLQESPG